MTSEDAKSRFALALTQAVLGKIPPELQIATGHDDRVMLFIVQVGDAQAATETLMEVITLSQADSILDGFRTTRGLIRKPFHIDDANRLKDQLELTGTIVQFIRPDEVGNAGA